MTALAARYVGRGIPAETVGGIMRGIMLSHPERSRDERWQVRYEDIDNLVGSAEKKYAGTAEARRDIAKTVHFMLQAKCSCPQIRAWVRSVAEGKGINAAVAVRIADAILREKVPTNAA